MNILLFEREEVRKFLPAEDLRTRHIKEVLRMSKGGQFYVGVVNGVRGKATIIGDDGSGLLLEIKWEVELPKFLPITLIAGLPRPQTGRKILEECASIGVARIFIFSSERGEESYASSKLWQTDEWRQRLIKGAEQAFTTGIPELVHFQNLQTCLNFLREEKDEGQFFVALDNYEAPLSMTATLKTRSKYTMAIGSERGWSGAERNLLREAGFVLAHLSERVLRMETACITGLSLIASRLGIM